jgi:hypothetical protein
MLLACRLAGLSALAAYYEVVHARTQSDSKSPVNALNCSLLTSTSTTEVSPMGARPCQNAQKSEFVNPSRPPKSALQRLGDSGLPPRGPEIPAQVPVKCFVGCS